MTGRNRWKDYKNKSLAEVRESRTRSRKSVFISHQKEDKRSAKKINRYLKYKVGVDTYLDIEDEELQSSDTPEEIVNYLKKGLISSTHLLAVLSRHTRKSWWVSFEYGFADAIDCNLAHLLLDSIDPPEFIETDGDLIKYQHQLKNWAKRSFKDVLLEKRGRLSNPNIPRL